MPEKDHIKNIAVNRKARHDFEIVQSVEAGIVLTGTEVKALRQNKLNMSDSYASISREGEIWLLNVHIGIYDHGNINNHEPMRERKLLLNKKEIRKLRSKVEEKGHTLVPLKFYFKNGKVKVELGLAKGKKLYDKREDIKKRDAERELDRQIKL